MPRPAVDQRFVIFTELERGDVEAAADKLGGPLALCARAGVRSLVTYHRAVARAPILPMVASALLTVADTVRGTQHAA